MESTYDPVNVVANRRGDVLQKYTILKSDHFPGCQNKKLLPLIEGAPNFRQVPDLPVYGVAIPTVSGLQRVLQKLGAEHGQRRVLWHNMREEPVLYINGKPYVVREANNPFANLEYTGINKGHVEAMEARLKQDVLKEAKEYGNQVMVSHEDDDFQILQKWEAVTEVDVQTPAEVYRELEEDGYDVDYQRVPVTDEKAPKERDFVFLVRRLWQQPAGTALVFNCQMGRGRTSTGMVIASLLLLRQACEPLQLPPAPQPGLPPWFVERRPVGESPRAASLEAELRAGKYGVIRSLLRVLEGGATSKAVLDCVVDAASAMQNLREAIAGYRSRLQHESNENKRNALLNVCLEYLERYYVLIAFTAYVSHAGFNPASPRCPTFATFMRERSELRSVLQRMLRRNPLSALCLHRAAGAGGLSPRPAEGPLAREEESAAAEAAEDELASRVASRSGEVLGPHTILKEDHFPGVQSGKLQAHVEGAPNFRSVGGQAVHGSAMPTAAGMRRVLEQLGCGPGADRNGGQAAAHWFNMREEVVVYVNGLPLVLREDERPFKNMQEYRGIDVQRLEQMEARLKADVLREAAEQGGQLLVAREVMGSSEERGATIVDAFVPVAGPAGVQTPREVYESLSSEGYCVTYHRVPVTEGSSPREPLFDLVLQTLRAADSADPVIFNCQMGAGRATMGMAIAGLVRAVEGGQRALPAAAEPADGGSPRSNTSEEVAGLSPASSWNLDDGTPASQGRREDPLADGGERAMEEAAMKDGDFVGVRRFLRILESGSDAKALTDRVVDSAGAMVNLRTAIMRYRRPQGSSLFYRPEINVRRTAFRRGSAYLERYCMLIAFASYLRSQTQATPVRLTFEEWMAARPEVMAARDALHQNPAGALAPVPPPHIPQPWPALGRADSREVSAEEQRRVLGRRRGHTLSRRSILKSYKPPRVACAGNALSLEGVADIRKATSLPIYAVGSCTVQGLRNLMSVLGARPGGPMHVVITDLREELVVYVNGRPYLRRELEMPSAALHHAGVHAVKLEELERRLRNDLMQESVGWQGRLLLHREVPLPGKGGAASFGARAEEDEDVTRAEDFRPEAAVAAFWESLGDVGDIDVGLATPLEVYQSLAAEGYQMSHRRVPLSRERTPEAADLDALHHQLLVMPEGTTVAQLIVCRSSGGSSARFAASFAAAFMGMQRASGLAGPNRVGSAGALAAPGSAAAQQLLLPLAPLLTQNLSGGMLRQGSAGLSGSLGRTGAVLQSARQENQAGQDAPELGAAPSAARDRSGSAMGEYRGIMNLCRVLPNGAESKTVVDTAIDLASPIGNLRNDILRCKEAAEQALGSPRASPFEQASDRANVASARRLGLHYLQRYFYLITFFSYLDSGSASMTSFARWMAERRELKHLLSTLSLEPVI